MPKGNGCYKLFEFFHMFIIQVYVKCMFMFSTNVYIIIKNFIFCHWSRKMFIVKGLIPWLFAEINFNIH